MAGIGHLGVIYLLVQVILVRSDNINFPSRKVVNSTVGGVWPKPQKQDLKDEYVGVLDNFSFKIIGKSCDILEAAVSRYSSILKTNWRHLTKFDLVNTAPNVVGPVKRLKINLTEDCEKYPHLDMDEKYILDVKKGSSSLKADSIWGILRGLETFSQLPAPAPNGDQLIIQIQTIEDFPKYSHRGLLIDTGRHFLSLNTIKKQIDILAYHKMNVLHWHIVDDQAFPYQSAKFPQLSEKGAFGPEAVYSAANIRDVVEHARLRGVRVIPEFDSPGHTDSFEPGMPDVHCHCPNSNEPGKTFVGPFDPTKNTTYEFMHDLFAEIHDRFPDSYVHLGGDEVDKYCWNTNPEIKKFMASKEWDAKKLQSYYMQNILKDTKEMSRKAIVWEEVFNNWQSFSPDSSFDKETIVQLWRSWDVHDATARGFKVIYSTAWYLDDLTRDFEGFYGRNMGSITNGMPEEQHKLVLGGEACMWGEKVDDTNIESRTWPRASAVAENLWSGAHEQDPADSYRIAEHVCRLRRRDVQAATAKDISYCADALPRPSHGFTGRFFSLEGLRQRLGLDDDSDEDLTYETVKDPKPAKRETVNEPTHSEKKTSHSEKMMEPIHSETVNHPDHSEKVVELTSVVGERSNATETRSGDLPVKDNDDSGASHAGMSVVVLFWSAVLLLKYV